MSITNFLPDGFLFGEGVKTAIKEKLLREFNLHTIVRLPNGVFAPYTGINTNLLFLERGTTQEIWFYEDREYNIKDYDKNLVLEKRTELVAKRVSDFLKKNNEFTFKDVHNEELFYQNGKILVEMVQLFEKYRIVYPSKHQFLGDLFEQLLNKGFKQNEGQFFTPIPITRFIWDSLPVDRMVKSDRGNVYPKVIDYACGAGHFLTEAIEAINYFVQSLLKRD